MKASADNEEPTGLRVSVIGSSAASPLDQSFLRGGGLPCWPEPGQSQKNKGSRAPGLQGSQQIQCPLPPQTNGTVDASSNGSSWTASFSRLSSRMSGAWILTWPHWKTSMSRTSSTCELQLTSDPALASSSSLPLGSPSKTSASSPIPVRLQKVFHSMQGACPVCQLGQLLFFFV